MTLYTESAADQTDHFANVFVRENVVHGYDVMTFESTQPTPFCLENSSVKLEMCPYDTDAPAIAKFV